MATLFSLTFNGTGSKISISPIINSMIDKRVKERILEQCRSKWFGLCDSNKPFDKCMNLWFKFLFKKGYLIINQPMDDYMVNGKPLLITFKRVIENNNLPIKKMYACYGGDIYQFLIQGKVRNYTFLDYQTIDIVQEILNNVNFDIILAGMDS